MSRGAAVALELVDIGGQRFHLSVRGGSSVEEVATELQKKQKYRGKPVLLADGGILDPSSKVEDIGSCCWQFHVPLVGVSATGWKLKLSLW